MRRMIFLYLLAGLVAYGAWAENRPFAHPDKNSEAAAATSTQTAAPAAQPPPTDAEYKIGAQDVLNVDVWKEPEITRTVPVRPDGKITLPLLNDVQAAGLTPMELAHTIRDGLKKYLTDPQVSVTVQQINSQRVYVTGEVVRPGAFPLLPNMTVLEALTSSGGFTQFAKTKNVYVLRMVDGKQSKLPFNYKAVVNGKKSADNIQLQPGDTIVVP